MMNKIFLVFLLMFSVSANAYLTPGSGGGGGSGNIVSINGDTTAAQLISGGTGITASTSSGNTTITATGGGGGVDTMGTFGSTPNSTAGSISGTTLTLQPASASAPGGIALAAQTMGTGAKTFSSNVLCATNGGCSLGVTGTKFSSGFFGTAVQFGATSTIDGTVDGAGTLDIRNATTGTTTAGMGHIGLIKVSGADNNMPSLKLFSHSGYGTNLIFPGGPNSSGSIGDFGFDNTYNPNSAPRYIAVSHDLIWDTDGSGDIGRESSLRPANIYALSSINLANIDTNVVVGTDGLHNFVSTGINPTSLVGGPFIPIAGGVDVTGTLNNTGIPAIDIPSLALDDGSGVNSILFGNRQLMSPSNIEIAEWTDQTLGFVATHFSGENQGTSYSADTGAGTSPTVTGEGSDVAGSVQVLTGIAPASSGNVVVVTFNSSYSPNAYYVVITPANAVTAALSGTKSVYVNEDADEFEIVAGSTALTTATTYKWNYHVFSNKP